MRLPAKGVSTLIALRCLCVFWGAWRAGAAAFAITPAASQIRALPFWTYVSSLEGVSQVLPDGPAYSGSCFLSCGLPAADRICPLQKDSRLGLLPWSGPRRTNEDWKAWR